MSTFTISASAANSDINCPYGDHYSNTVSNVNGWYGQTGVGSMQGNWWVQPSQTAEPWPNTFIGPLNTPAVPNPFVPVTTIQLDPRVPELEKKIAALEELVAKLLPKALELQDPPKTDGKRVVEL